MILPLRVLQALVPAGVKEAIALAVFTPIAAYIGYVAFVKDVPNITVFTEATYPKQVNRDGYFYLSVDVALDQTCTVSAKRIFTGSDGVDYLASEDEKDVTAGERMRYIVRVPVVSSIPYGVALYRSDIEYACDWYSRYIMPRKQRGRIRAVEILPSLVSEKSPSFAMCDEKLIPKPGFSIVRAHYRKKG